jgi:hypothetical protein
MAWSTIDIPPRGNVELISSSYLLWLKTVQTADRRPHGNGWNLVSPSGMMAQNGPTRLSVPT